MDNKKMSKYRIVTIIFGAISILDFFFMPFYHSTLGEAVDFMASLVGEKTGLGNISAFRFMIMAFQGSNDLAQMGLEADPMIGTGILLLIPVLLAVMAVVFGIIGGKAGGIGAIICSCAMTVMYVIDIIAVGKYEIIDYGVSIFYYFIFIPAIIILIMGILELKRAQKEMNYNDSPKFVDRIGGENTMYDGSVQGDGGNNGYRFDRPVRSAGLIEGIKGEYAGATLSAEDGVRITIGRSTSDCNLIISNPAVSRIHCYITYYGDRDIYEVMDVSRFGVFDTRGNQIANNQPVFMAPGDEIHIGKSHNVFRLK